MSRPTGRRDSQAAAKILAHVFAHPGPHANGDVAAATGCLVTTVASTLRRESARNPHLRHNDAAGRYGGYIYDGPPIPVPGAQSPANGLPAVGDLLMVRVAAHVGGVALVAEEDGSRAWVLKTPTKIEVD